MTPGGEALRSWLQIASSGHAFNLAGLYRRSGDHEWPLTAVDEQDLEQQLTSGQHLIPLPSESAALANLLEVALVDYLIDQGKALTGVTTRRGTERGYPDLELTGGLFGDGFHAVDIKAARRSASGNQTQSRITLYTGNTYFRYPELHLPGTFRPFRDYESHLDVIVIYTFKPETVARIDDVELVVQEPWRIGSKMRSSTTREYIGAVQSLEALRNGQGEFAIQDDFYQFWRKYHFKTSELVQRHQQRLLASSGICPLKGCGQHH